MRIGGGPGQTRPMSLFLLPRSDTRSIGWREVAIAAAAGEAIGLAAGLTLDLHLDGLLVLFLPVLAGVAVVVWPGTVLLAWACSRVGAIGYAGSLIMGALIGLAAVFGYFQIESWVWVEPALSPEQTAFFESRGGYVTTGEKIWYGLSFGLISATACWLVLHRLRPRAFRADPIAARLWGRVLYAFLPVPLLIGIHLLLDHPQVSAAWW